MIPRTTNIPQNSSVSSCMFPPIVSCSIPDKPFVQITVKDAESTKKIKLLIGDANVLNWTL